MDHPNIANVLDAGATDAGLPFFVMEQLMTPEVLGETGHCHRFLASTLEPHPVASPH
jgi:hypothetical protein